MKIAKFFQARCQLNGIIFYAIVHTKIKTTLPQVDSDGGTNSYTPDELIGLDDIDSNLLKLSTRAKLTEIFDHEVISGETLRFRWQRKH